MVKPRKGHFGTTAYKLEVKASMCGPDVDSLVMLSGLEGVQHTETINGFDCRAFCCMRGKPLVVVLLV